MNFHRLQTRFRDNRGQALIEFALSIPMVFLLIVNLVNFGGFFYAWISVANAARAGADYAILGYPAAGAPSTPTATQVQNLIKKDVSYLPNVSSLSVNICSSASATPILGTCTSIPSDPEPSRFVLLAVDVTYTYKPFIPVYSFPKLGVYLTLPPTTVFQRSVMRSLQ